MRNIKHIVLVIFFVATCAETSKPQETNLDWRQKYGIWKGKGAIVGYFNGDTVLSKTIGNIEYRTKTKLVNEVKTEILEDNIWITLNLQSGIYDINIHSKASSNDTIVVINNVKVAKDSITVLRQKIIAPIDNLQFTPVEGEYPAHPSELMDDITLMESSIIGINNNTYLQQEDIKPITEEIIKAIFKGEFFNE
ncbi:hypothetical protein H8E88_27960 [candidate division KSB1 bacterium]|nr:hypothetical protein [candidate division KSB1 bacterium]